MSLGFLPFISVRVCVHKHFRGEIFCVVDSAISELEECVCVLLLLAMSFAAVKIAPRAPHKFRREFLPLHYAHVL